MCASQLRASTGISVSLAPRGFRALLGDRPRQLARRRQRRPHQQHAHLVVAGPPAISCLRPRVGDGVAIHAAPRSDRAGADPCRARTVCSSARTRCRSRGRASRRSPPPTASSACRSRLSVALRTNSSRLARSCWNCGPDGRGGSGSAGGGAALAGRGRRPRSAGGGGRRRRAAPAGRAATRDRTRRARPSSDRMRYASVSSAARSAAIAWNSLPRCWTLSG